MNPVTFNCTVLRDGHQSLAATRMKTEDMLPIAPILDSMGFSALETWGRRHHRRRTALFEGVAL